MKKKDIICGFMIMEKYYRYLQNRNPILLICGFSFILLVIYIGKLCSLVV
jgi:hypothetical protein